MPLGGLKPTYALALAANVSPAHGTVSAAQSAVQRENLIHAIPQVPKTTKTTRHKMKQNTVSIIIYAPTGIKNKTVCLESVSVVCRVGFSEFQPKRNVVNFTSQICSISV